MAMFTKIMVVVAFVVLPFSVALWHKSHHHPEHYRYDVTLYKSLRIYLKNGTCGLRLLSMPQKTASASEFRAPLERDPLEIQQQFALNSARQGPYRVTWLVFPFWFSTLIFATAGSVPVILGPLRRRWRKLRGACEECGYNLEGNRSGVCPECGTRFRGSAVLS
jgi:hypothetical protein